MDDSDSVCLMFEVQSFLAVWKHDTFFILRESAHEVVVVNIKCLKGE